MHRCHSVEELDKAATHLLEDNPGKRVFAIYGNMGAGKTTLIKALCRYLQAVDVINSPTFAIVNEYKTQADDSLFHFDFYRIKNEKEALSIGFDEYIYSGAYCFMEWPEKIEALLPEDTVIVKIEVDERDYSRLISWEQGLDN
ncbi:MAG: tRNA (adenosine(37)-N6)-threonylcarbamoyltransferase complex ATPase subunit type 1 TsaE [Bacteroidales bacterium]|nr:tRNA (adenosine(37)-N6)-threonylcarbamoyltransferase complex ATPase subunit type 1 TsaE [Bacteroidales bacterium]